MSSVVIAGDTSGTVTLDAPAVAGTTVLTLPATSGTLLTSVSFASILPSSINGPAFSAYLGSNQTVTQSVNTKLQINTEEFDTNSNYDTANYRFTPTVAGYYQVNGAAAITTIGQTYNQVSIYKNGSEYKRGTISSASGTYHVSISTLVYLNGSTDYIELYGQTTGATPVFAAGIVATYFQAVMIRSA
jgi:hypothetical protein